MTDCIRPLHQVIQEDIELFYNGRRRGISISCIDLYQQPCFLQDELSHPKSLLKKTHANYQAVYIAHQEQMTSYLHTLLQSFRMKNSNHVSNQDLANSILPDFRYEPTTACIFQSH